MKSSETHYSYVYRENTEQFGANLSFYLSKKGMMHKNGIKSAPNCSTVTHPRQKSLLVVANMALLINIISLYLHARGWQYPLS